jgi:signal transduction histidine kinase
MSPRSLSLVAGLYALAAGAIAFVGWSQGMPRLTDWFGTGITMKTNTTLLSMLSGGALLLARIPRRAPAPVAVAVFLAGVVVAIVALLTLLQHLLPVDFGIDMLLYPEPPGSPATAAPNRMGVPASVCFALLGTTLCLLALGRRRQRLAIAFCLLVFALGMLSLTGYWYDAEAIYALPRLTAIASQTALIVVVLSIGLMAAFPEAEPTRTLFADDNAGTAARRLLPFLFGVPLVLGWLRLEGQRRGLYDSAFGTALRTWIEVAILSGLAWWAIRAIHWRDVQRRDTEATLRDADRRKDEFLATLSHELRNPLAPIRNAASILTVKDNLEPPQRWAAEVIERQVRHMSRLLDDLLDVSRITRDRMELRRAHIDLNETIRAALEASRPVTDAAGHELQVDLCDEALPVDGDADRLAQVFSNLLNNAAKYTAAGGHVSITSRREGTEAVVRVRDDGIGIDAAVLPHIFEMFSQATSALERSQGGLGIGLSLARGVAELHGGSIEARSGGAGMGSEFTVRLPCA